ncbi:hypothetical protein D7Z94_18865 [Ulvibacterium marinum]|uniref:DoxX family protein n=1 Tax=Ulvibacterium marinum TaxID=2419782 RepID=A0A3B0C6F6_9FLAO|nr:hypothetical protein D7Z94_18865 [Ulvibacterium marinum]
MSKKVDAIEKKKRVVPLLHVLTRFLLIGMPYFLSLGQYQDQILYRTLVHFWMPLVPYEIIF